MALPNLRDEGCRGAVLIDLLEQLHPVDFAVINLQAFSVDVLSVRQMQVCCKRQNLIQKLPERLMQMVAGQL